MISMKLTFPANLEGKGKKGVTYPTVLEYVEVKVETVHREVPPPTVATTQPAILTTIPTTTSTTPTPTTPQPTTPKPTTTTTATTSTTTTTTTTTARLRPPLVRARDTAASNIHPAYSSIVAASSKRREFFNKRLKDRIDPFIYLFEIYSAQPRLRFFLQELGQNFRGRL
ncbi:unnamed protein product [Ranitomeya imitator]|uniref:Uncharacterized protein n=1 Tax=Ranitomeya imitator TaxID=111125 RepID=A0ABN9LWH8_9NEOB|nr:unnamed protein product [Ranitomeya imitator]